MTRDPRPSDLQDRFLVRLPDGLRGRIKDAAKRNRRPMNSEIVLVLERSFGSDVADGAKA